MGLAGNRTLQNGTYALEAQLGQGYFGITYKAIHLPSQQPVVIKTLAHSWRSHPQFAEFAARFLSEARRFASCPHPHLASILDCFVEAQQPYIVWEFIPGKTLTELMTWLGKRHLPEAAALRYIRQLGSGISWLHQSGLRHGDIRPPNIIWRADKDEIVLTDPGIVREFTPGTMQTHAGLLAAGFAPLEQYLPHLPQTSATDIYALAATLYYLLAAVPPIPAVLRQLPDTDWLQDLRNIRPDLSPEVERALLRGLAITSDRRPQNVEDWLALLPSEAKPETTEAVTSNPDLTAATPEPNIAAVDEIERNGSTPAKPRRLPLKALAMTAAIAAIAGLGSGLAWRWYRPTEPGSTLLHTEQSFPPRDRWPISNAPNPDVDTIGAPEKQ